MRLLADENVDAAIIDWLRATGHDLIWAAETLVGKPDDDLLALAKRDMRVLITNDLDYGELVYRRHRGAAGIIVKRFRARSERDRLAAFQGHWPRIESGLRDAFVVLRDRQIRRRRLPI